ncbi:unannotated protein [freshwater metagenome]|uniref:Unannotated protein n=1 Tax=freshwater metagenome TaxID=449393 RepID=A0A6J7F6R8_9ZZZZ
MVQRGALLVCASTGADLAEHARAQLEAIVAAPAVDRAERPETVVNWGVQWFCPADGHALTEESGALVCGECGRSVAGGLVYELIEFNAH